MAKTHRPRLRAGCHPTRENFANGWCHTCYQRHWQKYGCAPDPIGDGGLEHVGATVQKVMKKVDGLRYGGLSQDEYLREMNASRERYRQRMQALKPEIDKLVESRFDPWKVRGRKKKR